MEKTWRDHLFPLFAVAVAFLYYGRFLDNFFTFDDFKYLENMYGSWTDVMIGYGSMRLVSNASWWPLFYSFGFEPLGYNLFALILFTFNAILLFYLLRRLLNDTGIAFLAASFFAAGSAGTDAIFWKATNSSLISLFFCLLALHCYTRYRLTGEKAQYRFGLAFFVAAMFSKEEAASLPLVAGLIDIFFFEGLQDKRVLLHRLLPFCLVVPLYVASNAFVFNFLLGGHAEPEKLFRFRPLYSVVGGGTAFYLPPDGFIRLGSPAMYATILLLPLSFISARDRRLVLFGWLWVFCAFLPQSFTGLGQFEPRVIVNSISRYLYITSIGSSIVFASVLDGLRRRIPVRAWYGVSAVLLGLFIWVHFHRVEARGKVWQEHGAVVRDFLRDMKAAVPELPGPVHIHVVNAPTGRAFIQQSLRAFYGNRLINWVNDPRSAQVKDGEPLYVVYYRMIPGEAVRMFRVR